MRKVYTLYLIVLHKHRSLQKENEDPKKPLGPKSYIHLKTKHNTPHRCDKTKGLGLGAVNLGPVTRTYLGEVKGRQELFEWVGVLARAHFGTVSQSLVIRTFFSPWWGGGGGGARGGTFLRGKLMT